MPNYDGFSSLRGKVTPETATEYLRHYSLPHVPLPFDAALTTNAEIWRQLDYVLGPCALSETKGLTS